MQGFVGGLMTSAPHKARDSASNASAGFRFPPTIWLAAMMAVPRERKRKPLVNLSNMILIHFEA